MTWWFPEHIVRHNELLDIYGDTPYYHVATDIYQALIPYGGYTPSAANPFPTVDWVQFEIDAGRSKAAYGRGGTGGFTVNNFLGTNSNGTYSGDFAFSAAPKVIVAPRGINNCTDTDASSVSWGLPSPFSIGFSQPGTFSIDCMFIDEFAWLATGQ